MKTFIKKIIKKISNRLKRPKRYTQIFKIIKKAKPRRIMEVGTWNGNRAWQMIQLAQKYYLPEEVEYYGFDLFEGMTEEVYKQEKSKWPPAMAEVKEKLEATGAKIFLFAGDTLEALPSVTPKLPKMDFIFIDGGHSLKTIANDWFWSEKLMDKKATLIFDDYWLGRTDAGCKVTVDNLNREKFEVKILSKTDHFDNTDFGRLAIKLVRVRKK